jgi:glycosyltransferase involved in cell wall biosynthesis
MHVLAKGLVSRGHQVVTVTAFPNYPIGRIYSGYKQRLWARERLDGVDVIRLPLIPDHSSSAIRRGLSYLSFTASACLLGVALAGPADVLIVYHPPATLAIPACLFRVLRKVPFVYEVQDMWPDLLEATGMVRNRYLLRGVGWLTDLAYSTAALVNVVTPGYKKCLVARGIPSKKVHVMLNWAYEGDFPLVPYDRALARELGMDGKFNVVYAGNMGPAQGLKNVLLAAKLTQSNQRIQFVLVGDGQERAELENAAKEWRLTNVRFFPPIPMADMPRLYSITQALLIHLTDDPLYAITIPGKTQSYLASGRPIIASVAGDTAAVVEEAGAGIAVEPMNPESLARVVFQMDEMTPEQRESMGTNGRTYHQQRLSPVVQIGNYERLLLDVLANG